MHSTINVKKFNSLTLTARLREIRGSLKQEQFASALAVHGVKVSRSKVSRWEDGLTEPSASELAAIAVYANCSIDEIVFGITTEMLVDRIAREVTLRLNKLSDSEIEFQNETFALSGMYSFSYFQMVKLKKIMIASQEKLRLTEEQYCRRAMSQGISLEDARFFVLDCKEEQAASRPREVVEAFLPYLFKVKRWDPLELTDFTFKSIEELEAALGDDFNNSPLHSSCQ